MDWSPTSWKAEYRGRRFLTSAPFLIGTEEKELEVVLLFAINTITWSPDARRITAEYGGTFDTGVWDTTTGENLGYFAFYHEFFAIAFYNTIQAVAWSPDGLHVAMSRFDRFVAQTQIVWGNQQMPCGPSSQAAAIMP